VSLSETVVLTLEVISVCLDALKLGDNSLHAVDGHVTLSNVAGVSCDKVIILDAALL